MKKMIPLLLLILIMTSTVAIAAKPQVNVIVNGFSIDDDLAEIVDDRTFVPLRAISEKLGVKVDYFHEKDREIVITKEDFKIVLNVGKLEAKIKDKEVKLDVKPYIKEDYTMVPLRFISEALGEEVQWNQKSYTAIIGNIAGKTSPRDYEKMELKPINGSIYFPKDYEKDVEITEKALTEGDLTIISKKLREKTPNGIGAILVLNNSKTPIIDSDHGYNLYYNPLTEEFVTVSYPLESSFPKEIRGEIVKIQEKYLEALETFQPIVVSSELKILKSDGDNKKIWHTIDVMKNMFIPREYFHHNIPYTDDVEDGKLVYLYNQNSKKETSSKVELIFDKEEKLISYKMKFYEPTKDLEKKSTIEEGIKKINLFQELILGYSKDNLPEVKLYSEETVNIYEKGVHEQFKDEEGNIYVYDLTTGLLEYYKDR